MNDSEKAIIAANIRSVKERIAQAAKRSGRDSEAVQLVAVSKLQSLEKVRQAYSLGIRDFGENRVYDALPKQKKLRDLEEIKWHMIGHIQSRKAKDVPTNFSVVHSIDRMKIAKRLDHYAGQAEIKLKVLLECNVSGEESKEGWNLENPASWPKILPVFEEILALENLEVRGLMTMAPFDAEEDELRKVFRGLRGLREYLSARIPANWDELSMGMTDDFEFAVEEGSTIVRIGRAIFGPREEAR
jgi:pyridoxal phosphate enzyme (YggS family)